jgi:vacuolar-type H+-ATPase subunit I/STV1
MMDQNALQAFPVWKRLFPEMAERVKLFVRVHEQKIDEVIDFRHKTGAHATTIDEQIKVRKALEKKLDAFMAAFLKIACEVAKAEPSLPDLKQNLLSLRLMPGSLDTFETVTRKVGKEIRDRNSSQKTSSKH